jgi:glycerophosphoryl diester phosphodiesterase
MMLQPYHLFKYNHSDDFTIIAHRGASAYYPENTIISFKGAMNMAADMVELDVQLTSDGEVVVFHDKKISRCTSGRGRIADYPLAKLKKLDAGSWFDKKFQGERIPTLLEVLGLCKNKIAVNIEIKAEAVKDTISGGIEEKCLDIVEKTGMRRHVVFSSFDARAIGHLRHMDGKIPAAVLFEKKHDVSQLPSAIVFALDADAFNCSRRELNKAWLADLNAHGIPVNVYTINDEKNMRRLLALGVDGIFTNKPDILKRVLDDFRCRQGEKVSSKA